MDLLLHDIAVAIERDCTAPPAGHWAWAATSTVAEHDQGSESAADPDAESASTHDS